MELVLKGVIIERLVSPYTNLLVVVRRKKVSKVRYINAYSVNQIIAVSYTHLDVYKRQLLH